ncbi:hypothetical protein PVAND_002580 [Polypedilum vanderplanki]|uniref:Pinin/SDK/MemA protein domain-containing protein n=1 Tax=Polypedilum vanderplanki TaxID=319348 RepID=A0A9J6BS54_POLVA|nr:hypothetical protein PVAND_002580 [Polypedilum vanderplanki]
MATISELNRSTEEKLDLAREKLKDINERLGSEKSGRDLLSQRRRPYDIKRTISMNSNSSNNRNKNEISYEEDEDNVEEHPKIMSRVVSSKDNNSAITKREQVIAIQSRKNDLERNKRMFGCLLGTLQKFRKEENFLKSKEEKKAKIERKLEEQEQLEKIKIKEERDALIANRKRQQLEVKILETKMIKIKDLAVYEDSYKHLSNYVKTATKPSIFWLPKLMTPKVSMLQNKTSTEIKDMIEERRKQVDADIKDIENQIDKECESNDDYNDKKSANNHNNNSILESENGRERKENNEKGVKRRRESKSCSPEIKKRVCSQVVVKNKD